MVARADVIFQGIVGRIVQIDAGVVALHDVVLDHPIFHDVEVYP